MKNKLLLGAILMSVVGVNAIADGVDCNTYSTFDEKIKCFGDLEESKTVEKVVLESKISKLQEIQARLKDESTDFTYGSSGFGGYTKDGYDEDGCDELGECREFGDEKKALEEDLAKIVEQISGANAGKAEAEQDKQANKSATEYLANVVSKCNSLNFADCADGLLQLNMQGNVNASGIFNYLGTALFSKDGYNKDRIMKPTGSFIKKIGVPYREVNGGLTKLNITLEGDGVAKLVNSIYDLWDADKKQWKAQ